MKKWIFVLLLPVLLLGCSKQETLETVTDVYIAPVAAVPQQISLELPESAAITVMESSQLGTVYICDDYTVQLQTLSSGDLDRTLQAVTGYTQAHLRLMETAPGDYRRYDCVWTTTGEQESQIGRTAILDDGSYHYVLTCMTGESKAQSLQETWNDLFRSFTLSTAP